MSLKKILVLSLIIMLIGTITLGCGGPDEDYEDIIEDVEENGSGESTEEPGGLGESGNIDNNSGGNTDF